jgi:hypothetical protein
MRPLHESGPARTAVSTIVREPGHVKGEKSRIARKVYSVIHAAPPNPSARHGMPCPYNSSLFRGVIRHFVLNDLSALHYEFDALKLGDVGQRVA